MHPAICYGVVATASVSASGAKANGVFVSPNEQSGIKAGDGGFGVNVKGNTDMVGAVIESTQAAIDGGKNSFATGGALTMSDLQNQSSSSGSSFAVSRGVSAGYTTAPTAATDTAPARDATSAWGAPKGVAGSTPTGSAGTGSYSGNNQNSTTNSGISGIAGNQTVRTGDGSSAGTLVRDWNTQTILRNVQAQGQISNQALESIATPWQLANQHNLVSDQADPSENSAPITVDEGSSDGGAPVHTSTGATATGGYPPTIEQNATLFGDTGMPTVNAIVQGQFNDCYWLAALGTLVQHDPETVSDMISINSNGTYNVVFPNGQTATGVSGESNSYMQFLTTGASTQGGVGGQTGNPNGNYVTVIENAYIQLYGIQAVINYGYGFNALAVLSLPGSEISISYPIANSSGQTIAGSIYSTNPAPDPRNWPSSMAVTSPETSAQTVASSFLAGNPVIISSNAYNSDLGIIGNHQYYVSGVVSNSTGVTGILLSNPWGPAGGVGFDGVQYPGSVTLTSSQFNSIASEIISTKPIKH